MRPPLHGVRSGHSRCARPLHPGDSIAIANALISNSRSPVRARNVHRRQAHPEAHVLDVPKARFNPPALAVIGTVASWPPSTTVRPSSDRVHTRPRPPQLVSIGHPSAHQPPRTPPSADAAAGRRSPPASVERRVFQRSVPSVSALNAIRKAPIRHDRPSPPCTSRNRHSTSYRQALVVFRVDDATVFHSRGSARGLSTSTECPARPRQSSSIQRDDYFLASTNNVPSLPTSTPRLLRRCFTPCGSAWGAHERSPAAGVELGRRSRYPVAAS